VCLRDVEYVRATRRGVRYVRRGGPPTMLLVIQLLGCTSPAKEDSSAPGGFGDEFLWGASIAGFQVDPGCPTEAPETCEDRASDWYQWVTDPDLVAESGNYLSGEPLSDGPGHHELYAEDIGLARDLHLNGLRTSIEWSRLFPDGAAESATTVEELRAYADPAAVAWYHDYFAAIHEAGLTPLVTLNHYTLPLWLHDGKACHEDLAACTDRGWLDLARMKPAITLYSAFCGQEFGGEVDDWATINEPLAIVLAGYLLPGPDRTNPPGVTDASAAFDVFFNLVEGHAAMYDALKANDTVDVDGDGEASFIGLVPNLAAVAPTDPASEDDARGVADANYVYNELFLNAAVYGDFDRDVDGVAEEHRPDIAGRMDYIGVNYYTRITVRGLSIPLFAGYSKIDFFPDNAWEEYPEGLGEVLHLAQSYGLPSIVTENGTQPTDTSADEFLRPHLQSLLDAKNEGVDVRGYFYWSLLDNYEWNHGMDYRFGLYAVDLATKERTLRPMRAAYAEIAAAGAL